MPAGEYKLYGDVVHANGFPETLMANLTVRRIWQLVRWLRRMLRGRPQRSRLECWDEFKLPDGYVMVWDRPRS